MSVQQFKKIRFCDWKFYFYLACAIEEQGFRACGRDKGAMKTDEVCGRPLDPFAFPPMLLCSSVYGGTKGYTN